MCHENKMGAAKNSTHIEQYKLSKDSGTAVEQGTVGNRGNSDPSPIHFNLLVIEINRIIYTSTRTVLRPVSTGTLCCIGVDNSTIDDVGTTTGITTVPTARPAGCACC